MCLHLMEFYLSPFVVNIFTVKDDVMIKRRLSSTNRRLLILLLYKVL